MYSEFMQKSDGRRVCKRIFPGSIEVNSAGLMAAGVHKKAIAVMKELGMISPVSIQKRLMKTFCGRWILLSPLQLC